MEPKHVRYEQLIKRCKKLPAASTAVAHPCDESSLQGAVDAARAGLIAPILVGPAARIREIASKAGINIAGYPIVEASFSQESAEKAVAEVRAGRAEALMKANLHTGKPRAGMGDPDQRGTDDRAPHQAPDSVAPRF
jgi:phosphate acetyltransferase